MSDVATQPRHDAGFTLVELIVVVVLMGLVTSAIAFAAMVMLRTAPMTNGRIDEIAAQRSLSQWLSRDLASAPDRVLLDGQGLDNRDVAGLCPDATSGENIVQIAWRVRQASGFSYHAVDYRLVTDGVARSIERTQCVDDNADLGSPTSQAVNRLLGVYAASQPSPRAEFAGDVSFVSVSLTLAADGGRVVSARLAPRGAWS